MSNRTNGFGKLNYSFGFLLPPTVQGIDVADVVRLLCFTSRPQKSYDVCYTRNFEITNKKIRLRCPQRGQKSQNGFFTETTETTETHS
jgi:hypothetical protein